MELDRRSFLKGAALSGAAVATAGIMGCSPESSQKAENGTEEPASEQSEDLVSWADAPEPIADVSETVDADVVVVGAGTSGCFATLAAVEAGAETVCLQKGSIVMTHGAVFGAIGSRWQQKAGYDYDINEIANAHARYNSHRPAIPFLKTIMEESARTLEWIADETGTDFTLVVKGGNHYDYDQPTCMTGHRTTANKAIDLGYWVSASTLEEAAEAFSIPADTLQATVDRYNELAAAGADEGFGKPAADLGPIQQGPFHIVRTYTPMDATMGGLVVNEAMQVVDNNGSPIKGLYATGNTQGSFYGATDYDLEVDGFSLGRAATSGRLAGENAAK